MRKLTGAVFQSLDGVMQAPGGPEEDATGNFRFGGWSFHFLGPKPGEAFRQGHRGRLRSAAREADLRHFRELIGPTTRKSVGATFQRINKYVLTHSDEPLEWENSHNCPAKPQKRSPSLKRTEGRDLLIQGSSSSTCRCLLRA